MDVAAIVDKAAAAKGEKLAWRTSIVDLMKALIGALVGEAGGGGVAGVILTAIVGAVKNKAA